MVVPVLGGDWYIDQMRIRSNESEPVPFSLPRNKYVGTNDGLEVYDMFERVVDIRQVMDWVRSDDPRTMGSYGGDKKTDFIPAKRISIPVNKENAIASGIVKAEDAELMVDSLYLKIDRDMITKSDLMLLDLLANFEWKRPLYFTQTHSIAQFGLRDYLQFDGYAYRLVPIKTPAESDVITGRVDMDYLYHNLMEVFRYGNVSDPRVYCDFFVQNNFNSANARNSYAVLAKELILRGEAGKAVEVLDYGIEQIPFSQIRHSYFRTPPMIEAYYLAQAWEKGDAVLQDYAGKLMEYIDYYLQFSGNKAKLVVEELDIKVTELDYLYRLAATFDREELSGMILDFYEVRGMLE